MLLNTALLVAGTLAISLPVGTLLSLLIARTDLPGRRLFALLLAGMLFVPLYLQAAAWQAGFGLQGWHTLAFGSLETPPLLAGWRGAIWVHAMAAIPWVSLIVGASLLFAQSELEEAALLDAGALRVMLGVTLPRALPAVAVAALWLALSIAGEITVTDLFQVRTYAEELYQRFALGGPDEAKLHVGPAVMLTALLAAGGLLATRNLAAWSAPAMRPPFVYSLGPWRPVALIGVLVLFTLLVGVPLGNLCYMGGHSVQRQGEGLVRSWSPLKLLQMIAAAPKDHAKVFADSLLIAGMAATLALAAAVPLAWLARKPGKAALPAVLISAIALAVPAPIVAIWLIELLNAPGRGILNYAYDHTLAAPVLVQAIKTLPLAMLVAWSALRSVSQETLDAAAVDGAGPLRRLTLVAIPQRRAALLAGWLVAFAAALGELTATILVAPPGVMPLSVQIFNFIHYGVDDRLAGLCLATLAMFAGVAGGCMLLARGIRRPPTP